MKHEKHRTTISFPRRRESGHFNSVGSALILAVVLTSLLAMVGVLFLMAGRVDKIATSAVSDNKELGLAVDTVLAKIEQELLLDVPGVAGDEYHDYPAHQVAPGPDGILGSKDDVVILPGPDDMYGTADDVEYFRFAADPWLADLEPGWVDYKETPTVSGDGAVGFRHITDLYGRLARLYHDSFDGSTVVYTDSDDDRISFRDMRATIVAAAEPITAEGDKADADGDGVADSRWIIIPDIVTGKGELIFVAVRIVDNGAMLNVNTAFKFDPCEPPGRIDGSSQMQINLMALSWRPGLTVYVPAEEMALLEARANDGLGVDPLDLDKYEKNVIWRYNEPNGLYTPFDISDELELRYRFLLNHTGIDTRLEQWGGEFRKHTSSTPYTDIDEWFRAAHSIGYVNGTDIDPNYAYRHIATTCNMDRIISPPGLISDNWKMAGVNADDVGRIYLAVRQGLIDGGKSDAEADALAAQIAVNIVDYRDEDSDVTAVTAGNAKYYGFERPCIYISELAYNFVPARGQGDSDHKSYAIELYKPYDEDPVADANDWRLVIGWGYDHPININWSAATRFHVLRWQDAQAPLDVVASVQSVTAGPNTVAFGADQFIELQRKAATGDYFTVDLVQVPDDLISDDEGTRGFQRDINLHKCVRRLWPDTADANNVTLGRSNTYEDPDERMIQAHPYLDPNIYEGGGFRNVGEIAAVFRVPLPFNEAVIEEDVRLDLADPAFQRIFNYLTVFDPGRDGIDNDGDRRADLADAGFPEWKVPGRININTAPWFVINQLPWMDYEIARAIVDYRDVIAQGFGGIGELMQVAEMACYGDDTVDLDGLPDLTSADGAADDFEERDVIFARISNLVTVRSDVFTAYILVRIGTDGPQKRVIAILDRSDVYSADGDVRLIALYRVPDPR